MGLKEGRYDVSDDHRITPEMKTRVDELLVESGDIVTREDLITKVRREIGQLSTPQLVMVASMIDVRTPAKSDTSSDDSDEYPENNVQIGVS